jgi:hypothetical protein
MSEKDSKVPIYIAILVAVLLIAAGGYFALGGKTKFTPITTNATATPTPEQTAVSTSAETPAQTGTQGTPVVAAPPKVETVKCELCHTNPQNLPPHVNGGKLCINCHGSQVHNIHIGPGTVGLQCDTCHGFPPKIPTVQNGTGPGSYSVCEQCHAAPPDSLKPSNGNLIVVHLSRGKYCTNCHGTDVGVIHQAAIANMTKGQ